MNAKNLKKQDIRIARDTAGDVVTNVPCYVRYHSPTGFNYGYGGSGPADLALNLAEAMLRCMAWKGEKIQLRDANTGKNVRIFEMSWSLHQKVKWQIVAKLQNVEHVLSYQSVEERIRRMIDELTREDKF